jgi:hypothetical protein
MSSLVAVLGISALCCDVYRLYTHRKLKTQQVTGWAMFTAAVCGLFASVTWASFINQNSAYSSGIIPNPTTAPTDFGDNIFRSEAPVLESSLRFDDTVGSEGLHSSFSLAYCILGWFVQGQC